MAATGCVLTQDGGSTFHLDRQDRLCLVSRSSQQVEEDFLFV